MSSVKAEVYATQYRQAVEATTKAAEALPEDKRFRQAAEGKAHPLWLLGHLTMSMDLLTNHWMLGLDQDIPQDWSAIFGPSQFGGRAITTNPEDYPAWNEILDAYKKAGNAAAEKVETLSDAELSGDAMGPMPDQFKEFFGILDVSIPGNAAHDTHHRGQMTLLAGLD